MTKQPPTGVSQWKVTGQRYGYWAYFKREVNEEIIKMIEEEQKKKVKMYFTEQEQATSAEEWDYCLRHPLLVLI